MALLTVKSVVVSLAFFPNSLLGGAWAYLAQKKPFSPLKTCNVTRGYAARFQGRPGVKFPGRFFIR